MKYMLIRTLTLSAMLIAVISGMAGADSSVVWNERINKNSITVWTRPVDGYRVDSFRAQADLDFSIEAIYEHLTNLNEFPEWVHGLKEFEIITSVDELWEYYLVVSAPLSKDRDNVMRMTGRPPGNDGTAFLEQIALLTDRPERRNTVRVTDYHETWNLVKLNDTKTRATLEVRFDPGGNPPVKVLNWIVAQGPYESFQTMIKILESQLETSDQYLLASSK